MKGFSPANPKYLRAFAGARSEDAIGQQPVGQFPLGHNLVLLTKLKATPERDLKLARRRMKEVRDG
jgi:hypothetical protein